MQEGVTRMVFRALVRKELLQMRWIIIVGLLFSASLAVIAVATFHYLAGVFEEIPADLLEVLSVYEVARELLVIFGDYTVYIWSQWHAKNLYQVGALIAIIMAASQFAGEVSRRTIGFYLTRPVTRRLGFLAKVIAGSLAMLIMFGGGTVLIWAASAIMGNNADWGRLFIALLLSLIWLNAYYLFGCTVSVFNREPITAGVLIGLAGIVLSLPGLFAVSRQFSIFYQMRAVEYFIQGLSIWPSFFAGLALNCLLLFVGLTVFGRKDF